MNPVNKRKTRIALAVGAIMSGMAFSQAAVAACTVDGETYTVNSNLDAISMTPTVVTLRQAILDANADPLTCDQIEFDESMNGQTIVVDIVGLGELDIDGNVNIVGPGSDQLTVNANGSNSSQRAMNFGSGDISVSGITFDGEESSESAGLFGYFFDDASLILDDIIVKNVQNTGLRVGGESDSDIEVEVTNSQFDNNQFGGALIGGSSANFFVTVANSTFTNSENGDGLRVRSDTANIEDIVSESNLGSGLNLGVTLEATVSDSTFSNNNSVQGGGIYISDSSPSEVTISHVSVFGNSSIDSGGGIHIAGGNSVTTISNSTISNNTTSDSGGGIHQDSTSASLQIIIDQSTISGNSADNLGGGIHFNGNGDLTPNSQIVRFSTITENTADQAGGIFANSGSFDIDISNTIVAGNTGTTSDPDLQVVDMLNITPNTVNASYSFFGSSDAADITNDNSILNGGDPMLADLGVPALSNGDTQVHEPEMGSPVIDIGDPALVAGTGDTPTLDQIGRTRVANSRIDIGSVEYNANVAPTLDVAITEGTAEVGVEFELDLDDFFSDANGDTITYSIANAVDVPAAIMITGSMLSATFVEADIGAYTVEYQACDNEPLCATGSGVLNVEAASEEESSGGGGGAFGAGLLIFIIGLLPVWMRRKA